jgi:hypothetical protein
MSGGGLGSELKADEPIMLPCRHCASVSLKFTVHVETRRVQCQKCGKATTVTIARRDGRWSIKTASVESDEED